MDKSAFKYQVESEQKPVDVPIGAVVRLFFETLDARDLPWAVLRGSEGLPDFTRYDIDLLILPEDVDRAENALLHAAGQEGWEVVRIVDKFAYRCCMLISSGPERRYLPIDFFSGCYHRFYPIADGAYGLDKRVRNEAAVAVVPPGFGSAVALLKELARHPEFKENSREEVTSGAVKDPETFRMGLINILGDDLISRLLDACRNENWETVSSLVPEIRQHIVGQRSWFSCDAIRFSISVLRHHYNPQMSSFIVLLGPDGSGKSTIADLVAEAFYKNPFKICQRYEYNFRIVSELKQLKYLCARIIGRKVDRQKVEAPGTEGSGMNPDHGVLKGMLYVSYYTLDFILGRFRLFMLRGRGALCIFSRYFQDYYYQRGYGNVPRWYLRVLECIVPKPDLILYLDRDADDIYRGKPELDVDEIMRQQKVIKKLVEQRSHADIIDASGGIESTVNQVKDRVTELFLSRHKI